MKLRDARAFTRFLLHKNTLGPFSRAISNSISPAAAGQSRIETALVNGDANSVFNMHTAHTFNQRFPKGNQYLHKQSGEKARSTNSKDHKSSERKASRFLTVQFD